MKTLITHLSGPKKPEFIKARGQAYLVPWSIEVVTIVGSDVVIVSFSEGHLEVTGVYERKHTEQRWDLVAEVGGTFAIRTFKDPVKPAVP